MNSRRRILFLDLDGVCNSAPFIAANFAVFKQPQQKTYMIIEHLDVDAIKRINQITDTTGAEIVISSAWRKAYPLPRLIEILKQKGLTGSVVGDTPILYTARGLEIQAWMDANNLQAEDIAIIDDMDDMVHLTPRLVKTTFSYGVLDSHVPQAIELLTE